MPANTYTLIEKIVIGSGGAATATFINIPQTYTDLQIFASARSERTTGGTDGLNLKINDSTSSYSWRSIYGDGTSAASENATSRLVSYLPQDGGSVGWTANTFASISIYIPNYTSSNNKSYSVDAVTENNGTQTYDQLYAVLWSNTSAITKLEFSGSNGLDLTQYSSFYLYGIAKEGVSPSPSSAPYATGGDSIYTDGTYWIHVFNSSGTFTPRKNLSCDYLVVAGGGGAGGGMGGGGGAGGLRSTVTATGGGGSLESALSLTKDTAYTVTVGAGGTSTGTYTATDGSNSVFSTITSTGGGKSGGYGSNGSTGGSGGGGGSASTAGGSGTSNQGYAGAAGSNRGGGGGGAGAVGNAGVGLVGGIGGNGVASSISGSSVTYAGGGGGGSSGGGGTGGSGGTGGGGKGGDTNQANAVAGTANTGSGGGGGSSGNFDSAGAAGGSGIVIVRYLK